MGIFMITEDIYNFFLHPSLINILIDKFVSTQNVRSNSKKMPEEFRHQKISYSFTF